MKVLFLDHDGVICLQSQWGKRNSPKYKKLGEIFDPFCPKAIKVLNQIIDETDCEIVISSDWRLYADLEYMIKMYKKRGIHKSPIAYTKVIDLGVVAPAFCRSVEINEFLKTNTSELNITHWVAVDDLNMSKNLTNFVHCDECITEGIKKLGKKEAIIGFLKD